MTRTLHILYLIILTFTQSLFVHADIKAKDDLVDDKERVTLSLINTPIEEILITLGEKAGVTFAYESSIFKESKPISFKADNERLEECLSRLLDPFNIYIKRSGRVIILRAKPRRYTISGFVSDIASSESLIGASVYDVGSGIGSATNSYGFFSLTLPTDSAIINVSYIGYETERYRFGDIKRDTVLYVALRPNVRLDEVIVTASDVERSLVDNTRMGAMLINQHVVKSSPAIFGESDLVKTLQLTPGVSSGTEGLSGMYVRGGDMDGNLFQIDGNPVYNVSHVGGLFSSFNPEAIRGMDFLKAGFPARYGGRLSSVVDVFTKDGNMREYHGSATIGLISGNLSFEGPIIKDKTSFQLSLRRSWLDLLSAPAMAIFNHIQEKKDGAHTTFRYAFHDLNFKVNHRLDDKSRMFISLYNGNDFMKAGYREFNVEPTEMRYKDAFLSSLRWGTLMATLGWTRAFNGKLFGRITANVSRYRSKIKLRKENSVGNEAMDKYSDIFTEKENCTSILDMGVRSLFDYRPGGDHHVRFGADMITHRFRPEFIKSRDKREENGYHPESSQLYANDLLWGYETALFIEDDWKASRILSVNGGLRLSLFSIEGKSYTMVEPRLSTRFALTDNMAVKASYSRMSQYVHLLGNSYTNLPADAWMPVTKRLRPLRSDQLSVGLYHELSDWYTFSVEGYYKWMDNLLDYKDGYSFIPGSEKWEERLAVGEGRSYGLEFMASKSKGNTTGWIGYTLSWSDRRFDEIDNGVRFPARYDNRHKLNIVATHKLSSKVEFTAAWTFASGNRMTLSLENYDKAPSINPDGIYDHRIDWDNYDVFSESIDHYSGRNNYKMSPYHRLDLGINIYRPKKSGRMGIWSISIYNVYSRMNPFMVYKSYSFKGTNHMEHGNNSYNYKPVFKSIGVMPIIPSISYTYKF